MRARSLRDSAFVISSLYLAIEGTERCALKNQPVNSATCNSSKKLGPLSVPRFVMNSHSPLEQ